MKFVYRSRKNGRIAYRFERPGFPKHWFKAAPGTAEFLAEWQRLMEGAAEAPAKRRVRPGSFAWLVNQYQASAAWAQLAPATQMQRRKFYKIVLEKAADSPAGAMTAKDVRRWRDNRAKTPAAANNMLKALSALYAWGLEMEHVRANPVKEVRHLPMRKGGFEPWSFEDVQKFRERWGAGTREHLALCLLLFTAVRRSDVVLLGRQHVRDGWLRFRQEKTDELVEMPILAPLAEAIDQCTTDMTFLVTQYGKSFTKESFGNWFGRSARAAGVKKNAHGLRKAAGGILAEMGCTMSEIAAILGHTDERTTSIYTKSAQRKLLAESGMAKMAGFKW